MEKQQKVYVIRNRETAAIIEIFQRRSDARSAMKVGKFLGRIVGKRKELFSRYEIAEASLKFLPKREHKKTR